MQQIEDWLQGVLYALVLKAIANGAQDGLEIASQINKATDNRLTKQTECLYPVLRDLTDEGLLRSMWITLPGNVKKKTYVINDHGRERLKQLRQQWNQFSACINAQLQESVPAET